MFCHSSSNCSSKVFLMDIQEAPFVLVPRVVLTEPILTMSGEPVRHFYSIFDSILPVDVCL